MAGSCVKQVHASFNSQLPNALNLRSCCGGHYLQCLFRQCPAEIQQRMNRRDLETPLRVKLSWPFSPQPRASVGTSLSSGRRMVEPLPLCFSAPSSLLCFLTVGCCRQGTARGLWEQDPAPCASRGSGWQKALPAARSKGERSSPLLRLLVVGNHLLPP